MDFLFSEREDIRLILLEECKQYFINLYLYDFENTHKKLIKSTKWHKEKLTWIWSTWYKYIIQPCFYFHFTFVSILIWIKQTGIISHFVCLKSQTFNQSTGKCDKQRLYYLIVYISHAIFISLYNATSTTHQLVWCKHSICNKISSEKTSDNLIVCQLDDLLWFRYI